MIRKITLASIVLLLLAALLSGCGISAEQPVSGDMSLTDRPVFSVSPDTFSDSVLDGTGFIPVEVSKGTIIQFEESQMGIVLTAMISNEKITTVVFQVQGKTISSDEVEAYLTKLNEVIQILLPENEISLLESLFFEAQSAELSEGAISSTVEKNDLTIMITPADTE